jgi:hypothetical protein
MSRRIFSVFARVAAAAILTVCVGIGAVQAQDAAPGPEGTPAQPTEAQPGPPPPPAAVMEGVLTGSEKGMAALHEWLGGEFPPQELVRRSVELIQMVRSHAAEMTPAEMLTALNRIMDFARTMLARRGLSAPGEELSDEARLAFETAIQTAAIAALQDVAPAAGQNVAQTGLDLPQPLFQNTDVASPS